MLSSSLNSVGGRIGKGSKTLTEGIEKPLIFPFSFSSRIFTSFDMRLWNVYPAKPILTYSLGVSNFCDGILSR